MDDRFQPQIPFHCCSTKYLQPQQKPGPIWGSHKTKPKWNRAHLLFALSLLLLIDSGHASGQRWDGAIVAESDFQALNALKQEFVDLKGFLSSWNGTGSGTCSGWAGIKCVNGRVVAIQLPWKGLGGRISEKIGQLRALRRLSLHDNVLVGPLPTSLGFLPDLRGVYLFNNHLSGPIPPSIGNCLLLQTLDLSNNQLTGMVSPNLANSTRLYRLNLSFNGLSGPIPLSLSQSPSLTILALQHNNISGSIPDTWGDGKSVENSYKLQFLALDHNLLSGKIPPSLSNLKMLEELSLNHNQIAGDIPDELGNLSMLNFLDLSNNDLDGFIPEFIEKLVNLSVLNLSNNRFKGRIPDSIGNVTNITSLDLSENNLTGEVPMSLINLPKLSSFDVSYNNLSGSVPSVLAKKFNSSSFVGNVQLCGYGGSTCPSPEPENPPSSLQGKHEHHPRKLSTKDIILIVAGALLAVLLITCCVLLCCLIRKKAVSKEKNGPGSTGRGAKPVPEIEAAAEGETGGKLVHFDGPFVFTADDLLSATAEIMGKSTYGTAYKATLEDNNNQVAVKRLKEKITKARKEFEIEITRLGKIRHPNILALRAYYIGPKGEKLLVFDYMQNGSLSSFLHARVPETSIPWPTRLAIAIGTTRGLCHLHTKENITHGNLTSSNILLDEQYNPKIGDVGLSRLMSSAGNTDAIDTAGTVGYRAPELSKLKNASTKSDVFSLGMIILELLTGKSPSEAIDGLDLAQWASSIVKEEWTNEVFDLELMRDASDIGEELLNVLKLALHCVDPSPAARPEVQEVLEKLEETKMELNDNAAAAAAAEASVDDGAKVPVKSEE